MFEREHIPQARKKEQNKKKENPLSNFQSNSFLGNLPDDLTLFTQFEGMVYKPQLEGKKHNLAITVRRPYFLVLKILFLPRCASFDSLLAEK